MKQINLIKRITFTLVSVASVCLIFTQAAKAQNVQLHYDLGHAIYNSLSDRPKLTTTVEMFHPDDWGSTFLFVDMDYADNEIAGMYWEIARELKFWKAPVSIHVEYNGGIKYIKDSYLAGATYTWNSADFSRGFTLSAMYKYIHSNPSPNNFQLTATWHLDFAKGKFSFSGFADFWRERHNDINGNNHDFVFIAEPQFWVNLNAFPKISDKFKLSIGTEWEVSSDFALNDGWYWNPTIALKWTFR